LKQAVSSTILTIIALHVTTMGFLLPIVNNMPINEGKL